MIRQAEIILQENMGMLISQKWNIRLLFLILHSLSVEELFMHTLCHAILQFYKSFTRKVQVYFPCPIDSVFLHAACFDQWSISGCNRKRGFTVCPYFGLPSCTSAICQEMIPGPA